MATDEASARIDSWIWAVRLIRTRSAAGAACRAGHVKLNGAAAKPAQHVKPGDDVRVRIEGRERIVKVVRPIAKRVGAPVAETCYEDHSPPPPPREERPAGVAVRERGAGRPTKRDRRDLEKLKDGHRPYF
ncbi:RNA-binding S4 domain-containing protein [Kitasatospora sp. NPDC088134]|uniref:RNA-binding S4 domain-containing protein n=1 Tax=Kitasatospora sp. NPDC088134 TaxID=3364071 RepID=UPI0037FE19FF